MFKVMENLIVIDGKEKKDFDENAFVLYDEILYILSMLKFNKIIYQKEQMQIYFEDILIKKYKR